MLDILFIEKFRLIYSAFRKRKKVGEFVKSTFFYVLFRRYQHFWHHWFHRKLCHATTKLQTKKNVNDYKTLHNLLYTYAGNAALMDLLSPYAQKIALKVTTWWPAKLLIWKTLEILHDCRENWITLLFFFWVDHSTIRHFRNEMGTGAEMRPAIVSGIVTWDASIGYWPFLPCPQEQSQNSFIFILLYLPHNNYKKYRKRRKKEVARRPNRNCGSLWEVRPPRTMS